MKQSISMTKPLDVQGLKICDHCNGYGSSLKDPIGTDTCTVCGGDGVVPLTKEKAHE